MQQRSIGSRIHYHEPLPTLQPKNRIDLPDGFNQASEDFEPFNLLSYKTDPGFGYSHVTMYLIEFLRGGKYGLCIWDSVKREFIEEPAELEAYGFMGLSELYEKHQSLKIGK